MAVRRTPGQALAAECTAMAADHIGLGPGLVDEDQALRIETMLVGSPALPRRSHVGSGLFVGEHGFF